MSGIAGSHGSSIISFVCVCVKTLLSFPQCLHQFTCPPRMSKVSFSTHQHLLFVVFLTIAVLTDVRCYFVMVLIWTYLIISDKEHVFMCLWPYVCLFGKMSIQIFCPF